MQKRKIAISIFALLIGAGTAFAFNSHQRIPGNLYWYNSAGKCVRAPCTNDPATGIPCKAQLWYEHCIIAYNEPAYETAGGQ